jgi:hypothetical protein
MTKKGLFAVESNFAEIKAPCSRLPLKRGAGRKLAARAVLGIVQASNKYFRRQTAGRTDAEPR